MTDQTERTDPNRPVVDLDVHSVEFGRRNYEIYDELRQRCPLAWSPANGGHWLFTDYASTFDAARNDELFSSAQGAGIPEPGYGKPLTDVLPPIHTDPPLTGEMRRLTLRFLSPAAADALEPAMRVIATEHIDAFVERGQADIVQELTTPLPGRLILRLLDFDDAYWPEWITIIHTMVHGPEGGMGLPEADRAVQQHIGREMARRTERGLADDDLVGTILAGSVQGRPLTTEEKFGYILLLLFGGMDTTSGLTGNALLAIARDPELRRALVERPDLIRPATEEFLRHGTPTQGLARVVSRDTEFHGQQLKAGERVLLVWAAANRDPAVFAAPAEVRPARSPNRHLAFGVGQHRCLGSNLARTMFRVMVGEILNRLPDFEVVGEPVWFDKATHVYAPRSISIRFSPGARVGSQDGVRA
jgi:cytochrome P450